MPAEQPKFTGPINNLKTAEKKERKLRDKSEVVKEIGEKIFSIFTEDLKLREHIDFDQIKDQTFSKDNQQIRIYGDVKKVILHVKNVFDVRVETYNAMLPALKAEFPKTEIKVDTLYSLATLEMENEIASRRAQPKEEHTARNSRNESESGDDISSDSLIEKKLETSFDLKILRSILNKINRILKKDPNFKIDKDFTLTAPNGKKLSIDLIADKDKDLETWKIGEEPIKRYLDRILKENDLEIKVTDHPSNSEKLIIFLKDEYYRENPAESSEKKPEHSLEILNPLYSTIVEKLASDLHLEKGRDYEMEEPTGKNVSLLFKPKEKLLANSSVQAVQAYFRKNFHDAAMDDYFPIRTETYYQGSEGLKLNLRNTYKTRELALKSKENDV